MTAPLTEPLASLVRRINDALSQPLARQPALVADALVDKVSDPSLLLGFECTSAPDRYVRHLLYAHPNGAYALAALVWSPGQMSPVHAHRTWCAFAVHRGVVTETFYQTDSYDTLPVPIGVRLRRSGDVSHGPGDPSVIHRLANLDCREAISVHAYGVAFEKFSTDLNLVYAP